MSHVAELLTQLRNLGIRLWVEGDKLKFDAPKGAFSPALKAQLKDCKAQVIQFLREAVEAGGEAAEAIPVMPADEIVPLSYAQERLWFLDRLEGDGGAYNIPATMGFSGRPSLRALEAAVAEIVRRHGVLRTDFAERDGVGRQNIHPFSSYHLPVVDLSGLDPELGERQASLLAAESARRPFDLKQAPLFRLCVLRLALDDHIVLTTLHHIISDGWSMGVLTGELAALYPAMLQGAASPLDPLTIQFADYAYWQRRTLVGGELEKQLAYWKEKLAGIAPLLELPTDRPRPRLQTYAGANHRFHLPTAAALKKLGREQEASSFMLLQAVFAVLLYRYSRQEDIALGSPIANRNRSEIEPLIGFFVNTLVYRLNLDATLDFNGLLAQVRTTGLEADAHQDVPFMQLVEAVQPRRSLSHAPLFQVMFSMDNAASGELTLPGLKPKGRGTELTQAKFDLTLTAADGDDGFPCVFEYNTDLFDRATIVRMAEHLCLLAKAVVQQPHCPIGKLPLLTAAERSQVLETWNEGKDPDCVPVCIHRRFINQAHATPETPAIRAAVSADAWTYRELAERAHHIAALLAQNGVGLETPVIICLQREPLLVAAMLGILQAGGCYVPLDPEYPAERIAYTVGDCQAPIVLTESRFLHLFSQTSAACLTLDQLPDGQPDSIPALEANPANLSHIIYTSGSTGKPKGAAIRHSNVSALLDWSHATFTREELAGVFAATSVCFDLSVFEIFAPLTAGGRVIIGENALSLAQAVEPQQITLINTVPSAMAELVRSESVPDSVLTVNLAGEPLRGELVRRIYQKTKTRRVINLYGPSEDTTYSTISVHPRGDVGEPTIGRPINGTRVYLLDPFMEPVPVGVPGELYLAGRGLARGYFQRPELTAERFVPNPFADQTGARLYRSGDLARYRADGHLLFLGRADFQIKLRGFRVELGEIEVVLGAHPAVVETVVCLQTARDTPVLTAYVTSDGSGNSEDLRAYLRERLPAHMVPAQIVPLAAMPRLPNGKINRNALPTPDHPQRWGYAAPRDDREQTLAGIWADLLKLERVGVHDNFFELGGDSILSIQVIARAAKRGYHFQPKQLFEHQTIAELAPHLKTDVVICAEQGPVSGEVSLTPIQSWFLEQNWAAPHHYNQSLFFSTPIDADPDLLAQVVAELVAHHDGLRSRFIEREGQWRQCIAEPSERDGACFQVNQLTDVPESERRLQIERVNQAAQAGLDLSEGPTARFVYHDLGPKQRGRLLLVVHHLAVDGVSWRVILEDLQLLYDGLVRQQRVDLPAKTTSFKEWSLRLRVLAASSEIQAELPFWQALADTPGQAIPPDYPKGRELNTNEYLADESRVLDAEKTTALLHQIPSVYRTRIDDILLAALTIAVARLKGADRILVNLEGHGREDLFEDVDLSRTVGWFTSLYPVRLHCPDPNDPALVIKTVKEDLRAVPNKGLGFGLLRYLSPDARVREKMQRLPKADIVYNYLGQVDQGFSEQAMWGGAGESAGEEHARSGRRAHALEMSAMVAAGRLKVSWLYCRKLHAPETIAALADRFQAALHDLIEHCLNPNAGGRTPSDFPLMDLNQTKLEQLIGSGRGCEDIYPLSPMQEGLLYHARVDTGSPAYFQQMYCTLNGALDVTAFRRAWRQVVERHAPLRASFHWEGLNRPCQVIHSQVNLPWRDLDWRGDSDQEQHFSDMLEQDRMRGFDLNKAPLCRWYLIRLDASRYRFLWSHHHLLLDGWSTANLLKEVFTFYEAFSREEIHEAPKPAAYRNFIAWLESQDQQAARCFWRESLAGFSAPTPLPGDRGRRPNGIAERSEPARSLDAQTSLELRDLAKRGHLTVSTLVQGAWALLLGRYTDSADVVFGVTVSGRPAELRDIESMVGLFINTLPTRLSLAGDQTLLSWLGSLQAWRLECDRYAYCPLADVKRWSDAAQAERLFESIVVFENYPVDQAMGQAGGKLEVAEIGVFEQTSFGLTLLASSAETINLILGFDAARFDAALLGRLLDGMMLLLRQFAAHPERKLDAFEVIGQAERDLLLNQWNDTTREIPVERAAHQPFERCAAISPEAVALIAADPHQHPVEWTYRQLNQAANRLAHLLLERGAHADMPIGLCMNRRPELIVAMLGILKAGAAYLPLDPAYPPARLAHTLQDAGVTILLSHSGLRGHLPTDLEPLLLDQLDVDQLPSSNPNPAVQPENLSHIIYTSGSTGLPKGVAICHGAVLEMLYWTRATFPDLSGVLAATSICFDLSVFEILGPLSWGGTAILAENALHLPEHPARDRVSLVNTVPSAMTELVKADAVPASVRVVNLAGEPLRAELAEAVYALPHVERLYNLYGPSEDTTYSTFALIPGRDPLPPAIGRPLRNTRAYLCDSRGRLAPNGVAGELYLAGRGLARGYFHKPDLTAARFVPDPFAFTPGGRAYRTGDLVCWRSNGELAFVGRVDHQIKLRGFRVELGEIEVQLRRLDGIDDAVVLVENDVNADQYLLAFVVATRPELDEAQLRDQLKGRLPGHMIPARLVFLEALPLSPNGKVDRKALAGVEKPVSKSETDGAPPRNETERRLVEIFLQVLACEAVGVHDDFFARGGHSLSATRAVSRIRELFDIPLPLDALFNNPTIAQLAAMIDSRDESQTTAGLPPLTKRARGDRTPLSYAQQRLWLLQRLEPHSPAYNMPYAFLLSGLIKPDLLNQTLIHLMARHEILRTAFMEAQNGPEQVIQAVEPDFMEVPLDITAGTRDETVRAYMDREAARPFDLGKAPLWRVRLLRIDVREAVLVLNLHHIIADGWSLAVFAEDFTGIYQDLAAGRRPTLPELPLQYADFSLWQHQLLRDHLLDPQLDYWKRSLAESPAGVRLPRDHAAGGDGWHPAETIEIKLSVAQVEKLRHLGGQHQATLFMTLLAVFKLLLYRVSGQPDIPVGVPIANRNYKEIEGLIGFFVNSLVLRAAFHDRPDFTTLLRRVRQTTLEGYANQDLPFNLLVETLKPERTADHNPMFNVMFALQNVPASNIEAADCGLSLKSMPLESQAAKFDYALSLSEMADGGIAGTWEFDAALFRRRAVTRVVDRFYLLLDQVTADPLKSVDHYRLMAPEEQRFLLETLNDTRRDYPADQTLAGLFEQFAARVPDRIALVAADRQVSYRELNRKADALAGQLHHLGVTAETSVAVYLNRSLETVVALLGILKAGGCYVGIDAKAPETRLVHVIEDAGITIAVTEPAFEDKLPAQGVTRVKLNPSGVDLTAPTPFSRPHFASSNLAYISYTSGSTGKPKGVAIHQRGVMRLCVNPGFSDPTGDDTHLFFASLAFDAATYEIWGALLNGGRLVVMQPADATLAEIAATLRGQRVSIWFPTPALFNLMVDHHLEDFADLRQIATGGDAASPAHHRRVHKRFPSLRLTNCYGPTEMTTLATSFTADRGLGDALSIPIGGPLHNTRAYVLDAMLQPVPIGVPGQLCVAGPSLARGYLKRPSLTAERFVPDPFEASGSRMYLTGDRVRFLDDGAIEFLGRIDDQLKIRGFRVEPGEIRVVLERHPMVEEALVLPVEIEDQAGQSSGKHLVGYIVPDRTRELDQQDRSADEDDQVKQWQMLFDDQLHQEPTTGDDPTLNLSGWINSYDGEKIHQAEMVVWLDDTIEKILACKPTHVLELGCGTGMQLFRVAPHCRSYYAGDISSVALDHVRAHLDRPALAQTDFHLGERRAEDFSGLPANHFDLVLLNSVAQYFPSVAYLLDVIDGAMAVLREGGHLFLGDIRDLRLLEYLKLDVELARSPDAREVSQLARAVAEAVEEESELLLDPGFFHALPQRYPQISHVEVLHKRGAAANELNRFRYDVRLYTGPREVHDASWRDWRRDGLDSDLLTDLLENKRPEVLALAGVPNGRVADLAARQRVFRDPDGPGRVGELKRVRATITSVEPEELCSLGRRLGYQISLRDAGPERVDCMDVVFTRAGFSQLVANAPGLAERARKTPLTHFANRPMKGARKRRLLPLLRRHLARELPEYMVPEFLYVLEALPLSSRGKVDRRALPVPKREVGGQAETQSNGGVNQELLASIWSRVLGVAVNDAGANFFDIGGHSLLATQVISAIRELFKVELPLRAFFESPTLAGLAGAVAQARLAMGRADVPPLTPRARDEKAVPLSFAQQRMWLVSKMDESSPFYNSPMALSIRGDLDLLGFEAAFNGLIRRHEGLRTFFPEVNGGPEQWVLPYHAVNLPVIDLSGVGDRHLKRLVALDAATPFLLSNTPPFRVRVFRLARDRHLCQLNMHHIITDGWSAGVLVREISQMYAALVGGRVREPEQALPELPIQYADFAVWQRKWLRGEALQKRLAYWRQKLAGPLPPTELPSDLSRPLVQSYRGAEQIQILPGGLVTRLKQLARERGATLFMVLMTAFKLMLARYTGLDDIIIGSPIANRNRAETEDLIGVFINTLALRTDLTGDPTFVQLLERVRETALDAYAHQDVPFESVVEHIEVTRDVSRSPVFQILFGLVNTRRTPATDAAMAPGLSLAAEGGHNGTAKFDVSLTMGEAGEGLAVQWEYCTDLYHADTVVRWRDHFHNLLASAVAWPERCARELPMFSEAERRRLLLGPARASVEIVLPIERLVPTGAVMAGDGPVFRVLDRWGRLAPIGVVGELCVVGALMPGAGQTDGTIAGLGPDPSSDQSEESLYRTGYRVVLCADGGLKWLGRSDQRVKVGVYQVELLEVEAAIRRTGLVDEVCVVFHDGGLAAHVVMDTAVDPLRDSIAAKLPLYMRPERYVCHEHLPRTPDGGLDRAQLAAMSGSRVEGEGERSLPADWVELKLLQIWREILPGAEIDVNSDFFVLGGQSLSAFRMVRRVEREFACRVTMNVLFQAPTIAAFAAVLRDQEALEPDPIVPIHPEGDGTPIFCVHPIGGGVFCYLPLATALGGGQAVYGLQSPRLYGDDRFETVAAMAAHYIEALERVQPEGPYRIWGWSMGGVIAHEMACQLGVGRVAQVVMIDSGFPGDDQRGASADLIDFALDLAMTSGRPFKPREWSKGKAMTVASVYAVMSDHGLLPGGMDEAAFQRLWETYRAHRQALRSHEPGVYRGVVQLIQAASHEVDERIETSGRWRAVCGEVTETLIEGDHYSITREPAVEKIVADVIKQTV